jgi:hypothetical protein
MINKILKAKSWQIFSFILIPLVVAFLLKKLELNGVGIFLPEILGSLFWGIWLWSMAIGLNVYLPEKLKLSTSKFKYCFVYFFSYLLLVSHFIFLAQKSSILLIVWVFLHITAMLCILYILQFVAKTITTMILERKPNFSEYIRTLLGIHFFPIGIWFIQPKINQFMANHKTIPSSKNSSILDDEPF